MKTPTNTCTRKTFTAGLARSVHASYSWKNGHALWRNQEITVRNFIARQPALENIPQDEGAKTILARFEKETGGAIWTIFWLHCWRPSLFPIYDQHVHRAMTFIRTGGLSEIAEKLKKSNLHDKYCPFIRPLTGLISRKIGRWTKLSWFGTFLKAHPDLLVGAGFLKA